MEQMNVQKLAQILKILVTILFFCNLAALLAVPLLVTMPPWSILRTVIDDLALAVGFRQPSDLNFPFLLLFFLSWYAVWTEAYTAVLCLFLFFCGVCTAVILWQARRVLDTIVRRSPFCQENGSSMGRAAVCCFSISGAALARMCWGFWYYCSIQPLFTYNALFVPVFLMAGLLCLVMSALFRQAAQLKAELDLTI